MFHYKVKNKYIWLTLLILVILALCFNMILSYILKTNLENEALSSLSKDTIIISEEINTYFSEGHTIISQMLTNEDFIDYIITTDEVENKRKYYRYDEVSVMLNRILKSNSKLLNVWLGVEEINDILTDESSYDSGDEFIYVDRPWYHDMVKENGAITFTDPYIDYIKDVSVITVVSPVYDGPSIQGVVGIDISINQIEEYIKSYDIGYNGDIFLLNASMNTLINSDTLSNEINYSSDIKTIINHNNNFSSGVEKINIDEQTYYISYSKVELPNWYVVVLLPEDGVFYNSKLLSLLDINSIVGLFAIAILMIPLQGLRKSYRLLSKAYADLTIKESELRELTSVNEAFNNQLIASELELHRQHEEIEKYSLNVKEQQSYIRKLVENDPLTELPNRRGFMSRLRSSLQNGSHGLVIMIDLDNFKEVNDLYGHVFGDQVLCLVSKELRKIEDEHIFVSRYGGDEFLIIIESPQTNTRDELVKSNELLVKRIIQSVNKDYYINDDSINIQGSFGVALYPYDSNNYGDLLKYVDLAMYSIKKNSHEAISYYRSQMSETLIKKDSDEKLLKKAIEDMNFELLYQPIIDSKTGSIKSFEALLRMKNRALTPSRFITIAEGNGSIIPLGRWVLEETIKSLSTWQKKGFQLKPISINFSEVQLNDKQFIRALSRLLEDYNIPGKYLEIEVTESILLDNNDSVVNFFRSITDLGVKLSLDDFGTGYATLSYLDYLPLSKLKIDKSLIDKDYREQKENGLVEGIIALAHSLNMDVVAEGVETEEQFNRLYKLNCDSIQGYYFSKPESIDKIELLFNNCFIGE